MANLPGKQVIGHGRVAAEWELAVSSRVFT